MGRVSLLSMAAMVAAALAHHLAIAAPPLPPAAALAMPAGDDAFDWMVSGQSLAALLLVAGLRIARGRRRGS